MKFIVMFWTGFYHVCERYDNGVYYSFAQCDTAQQALTICERMNNA